MPQHADLFRVSLDPNQDLAKQIMGRRVGDTVVLRQDLEELSYEVVEVQSKFVRAFQETAEEFSTRFPGNMGLSRIRFEDDDYTKVFQIVEQRDHAFREAERMYQEGRIPFASFSSLVGRSTIELWRATTLSGTTRIRFRFRFGRRGERCKRAPARGRRRRTGFDRSSTRCMN